MAQPVWITPAGSLGTVPEGVFYSVPLAAYDPLHADTIYYEVLAGELPPGVYCDPLTGIISGVPTQVSASTTSQFAIRAYTQQTISGVKVIKALADRTFTMTVNVNSDPQFTTPQGQIAEYYDGSRVLDLQVEYTDPGGTTDLTVTLVGGQLPPGLTISKTGVISGFIEPNVAITGFSPDDGPYPMAEYNPSNNLLGFDDQEFDVTSPSTNANYSFTLRVASPTASNLGTFSIFVVSQSTMTADNTFFTADNTFITADATPARTPILLNTPGSLGNIRNGNFFAYQFIGESFDGDPVGYSISVGPAIGYDAAGTVFDENGIGFDQGQFSLPPGLQLDTNSGWLYGYIPDLGITEISYNFAIQVYNEFNQTLISPYYYFSMNIVGQVSSDVTWLTPSELGTIDNGSTSLFYVKAVNTSGIPLQYQLQSGSTSSLPQGLQLLPSGDIAGRVSFDTFALDGGSTTFDATSEGLGLPYFGTPTTFDMKHTFTVNAYSVNGVVSVFKTFSITVDRKYDAPYQNLYIQCMPPQDDRALISSLLQNNDIFPNDLIYRPDDPNFGVATKVIYNHAYGLTASTQEEYLTALQLNHYWKTLTLGQIKTARAVDPVTGATIYEVVYSEVVDNLVNNAGESVGKEVTLAYPVENGTVSTVYPNSLADMRNQVIDVVGQESNILPLWMLSKQENGQVLGFTPAWVIAYTQPGQSGQVAYNIQSIFGSRLNLVDFDVDRYELDNLLTVNWLPSTSLSITNVSGDGAVVTVTYDEQYTVPFTFNEYITLTGVNPSSYNGTYVVASATSTQVALISSHNAPYVSGGTITGAGSWIPNPATDTTFDLYKRPSQLDYIRTVDFATEQAFVDINGQTINYIQSIGGLDGPIDSNINGKTIIFVKQQDYVQLNPHLPQGPISNDQAWTLYLTTYDAAGYSTTGVLYDEATVIPGQLAVQSGQAAHNQRMGIWRITVNNQNIVTLTLIENTTTYDYVQVTGGVTYNQSDLYVPEIPGPGLTLINWQPVSTTISGQTVFDGNSIQFIAPSDMYSNTTEYDKYLVFPKRTILG